MGWGWVVVVAGVSVGMVVTDNKMKIKNTMKTNEIHIRINEIKARAAAVGHECIEDRDGDVCIRPRHYNDVGNRVVRYWPDPCEFKPLDVAVAELEAIEKKICR